MKLITLTPQQQNELRLIHPEHTVADYAALVPEYEYRAWAASFESLTYDFANFFGLSPTLVSILTKKIPLFHWTAKLIIPITDGKVKKQGVLQPKAFKTGFLAEGTYKDFGFQSLLIRLLNSFWSSLNSVSDILPPNFPVEHHSDLLGLMVLDDASAFDDQAGLVRIARTFNIGDRYLPLFIDCTHDPSRIEITTIERRDVVSMGTRLYRQVIPTHHYNEDFQDKLKELNQAGLLVTPLNFAPARIEAFLDFEHEAWATVYPYPGSEQFQLAETFLLIQRDSHKIYSWATIQSDPILRLALGMEDEWLWQEACPSPFPNLNLYWSPVLEYPWFRDRKTKEWVPAFILKDE
jgi:hypothetical protein